ncbi:MAG TPA: nucleoside deaminase [Gemmatales bacterium]|nr:nucleoside deaminase [Gemmatales bacterium]
MSDTDFMERAVEMSLKGMRGGHGGPFGAVIVRAGQIIAEAHNEVLSSHDPTAHAEVLAIRRATAALGHHHLGDCVIYTSCEPCPMCLGAIYWSRLQRIYFGNTRADAAAIGFDDQHFYDELARGLPERRVTMIPLGRELALAAFTEFRTRQGQIY